MHHPLADKNYDHALRRVERQLAALGGMPELELAKVDYAKRIHEAIAFATVASAAASRAEVINDNASAQAEAAKATYHFLESTNLHCAAER